MFRQNSCKRERRTDSQIRNVTVINETDTIYRRVLNKATKTATCTLGFGIRFRDTPKGLVCCYVRMLNVKTLFKSLVLMNNT